MYAFEYDRPRSVAEAVRALKADSEAKSIAGGMTLLPAMKLRLAGPSRLVSLDGLDELVGIRRDGGALQIGAMTRHAQVASSSLVRERLPALAHLAGHIGDPQVRNRGTLGGSIANNDPAADYPAALVALGATVFTDRRALAAEDFFTGMFSTALAPDELIVRVAFPLPKRACYVKFPNPASGYAVVGVMVAQTADGVRVAVTGASASVFRVPSMEQALSKRFEASALDGVPLPPDLHLNDDLHASADYRAHLITVMAKRAVAAAND